MKSPKLIAIAIAVLAFLWILSGALFNGEESGSPDAPKQEQTAAAAPKQMEVRIREIKAESFIDDVIVTGRSRASRSVELEAETEGQIAALHKEEGDAIAEGELLAELEVRDREAKVKEAKERVDQRQIEYNAAKSLETQGFNSRIRLAQARADLENARAELKQAEVDLAKTKIKAPFDGVIFEQNIEVGDFVAVGDPLYTIVDLDPVELTGYVSERRVHEVEIGTPAKVLLLNGTALTGTVTYVAPAADPETRTFRTVVSLPNPDRIVKEGQTARLSIPVAEKAAHKISPSVLTLNDAGQIGVKLVTTENKVAFVPVTILSDTPDFMWVSGLPETARLITVGQEFVVDGQSVKPVAAGGEGLL